MIFFFTTHSLWLSGLALVVLPTFLAMSGPLLVRRFVVLEKLATNNEVAGFKFATVGVLYAVLLAFATIVVWEKFSESETIVAQEAGAAANVYRLSLGIKEEPGNALRARLSSYLHMAISDEWPAMERGRAAATVRQALDGVYAALTTALPSEKGDPVLMAEIFRQLDGITQARRERLTAAEGIVPGVLWYVLFGGAVATIAFTFFFGSRNVRAQMLMTGLLSFLIFSELLIIVVIDRPFAGPVSVTPEALDEVLADFGPQPARP